MPYLHHFYFLQMAQILALSPVPLLAVTATVELHSGNQARLPDCLAVILLGQLYLALSLLKGRGYASRCYSTAYLERESPHDFGTVPLNDASQGNLVTSLINCSRAKNPVVPSTYRSLSEISPFCTMQMTNTWAIT